MVAQTNRHTFEKSERILKRYEFNRLKPVGRKIHTPYFLAVYTSNAQGKTRIGISVSRHIGNAVLRNRIKRRIREYYRNNKIKIIGTWDIHVIARKYSAEASNEVIEAALEEIFGHFKGKELKETGCSNCCY